MLVVLDTNVLVSAIRSRRGASFRVLSQIGAGRFDLAVSVPLVLEYESVMLRSVGQTSLSSDDVAGIIDYLCLVGRRQAIFYLWRPLLKDPGDDMVAEVAVAAGCDAIVTHNRRDFAGVEEFGMGVWAPGELLRRIGGRR